MKIIDSIYLVASGKWGFGITQAIDCNVFLISTDDGCILIDSGTGLEPERMDAVIESHGFSVKDIRAVVLTHYHGDHACGASRIQKLSGCRIYAPELEAKAIEEGDETATSVALAKGGRAGGGTSGSVDFLSGLGEASGRGGGHSGRGQRDSGPVCGA